MSISNLWWMAAKAVHEKVVGLDLNGISVENRRLQVMADDKEFNGRLPAVSVSPAGVARLDPTGGGNVMDDPGYPVLVGILDSKESVKTLNVEGWLQRWLLWRETLETALHHKNGPDFTYNGAAISTQFDTVVTPGPMLSIPAWFERQICLGTMTVRVDMRRSHL